MLSRFEVELFTIYFSRMSGRFFYMPARNDIIWGNTEAELRKVSSIKADVIVIEGLKAS